MSYQTVPDFYTPFSHNAWDAANQYTSTRKSTTHVNAIWYPMVRNWFADLYKNNDYDRDNWVQYPYCASILIPRPIIKKNKDSVFKLELNLRFNAPKSLFNSGNKRRGPYQDWVGVKIKSIKNPQISIYNFSPIAKNRSMHRTHQYQKGSRFAGRYFPGSPNLSNAHLGIELEEKSINTYEEKDFECVAQENGKKNSVSWDMKLKNSYHPQNCYVSRYDVNDPKSSLLQRTFGLFYYWDYFYKVPPIAESTLPLNLNYNFQIDSKVSEGTEFRFDIKLSQRLVTQEIWHLIQDHYFINFKKFKCALVLKYENDQIRFDRFEKKQKKPTITRYYIHPSKGHFTYKKDMCVSNHLDDNISPNQSSKNIIEKSEATKLQKQFRKSLRFLYHRG